LRMFKYTREICVLIITVAIAYKLVQVNIKDIELPTNMTDLIAFALSIFSILLSALFYFKANEASNKFYDNTYQFTKDISEKIGRIEERFGKDLSNIEKGYSRMLDKMDRYPMSETIEKEIEHKTDNEERLVQEREKLINDLIQKANITQEEKEQFSKQLAIKEAELIDVKEQLFELKNKLDEMNYSYSVPPHTKNVMKFLINNLRGEMPRRMSDLMALIENRIANLSDRDKAILIKEGMLTDDLKLTSKGRTMFIEYF